MFPPFNASLIIDPAGAYTTAAAAVAKVQDAISSQKLGSLSDKTCAVFGTGSCTEYYFGFFEEFKFFLG